MERLARYLEDTNTSQTEFAKSVGVSQPTVSEWLSGEKTPTVGNLAKISRVTRLSTDELLGIQIRRAHA